MCTHTCLFFLKYLHPRGAGVQRVTWEGAVILSQVGGVGVFECFVSVTLLFFK